MTKQKQQWSAEAVVGAGDVAALRSRRILPMTWEEDLRRQCHPIGRSLTLLAVPPRVLEGAEAEAAGEGATLTNRRG